MNLILVLCLSGEKSMGGDQIPQRGGETRNLESAMWMWPRSSPRAVALVLHGLNLRPERMDAIARALNEGGVAVLRGSLSGHDGESDELYSVTDGMWLSDGLKLFTQAEREAVRYGVPLFFVGYSLGCLVALDLMERFETVRFERLVLFAPPLEPRVFSHAVRLLGKRCVVPSRTPEWYRVHNGTPAGAYDALLDLARHLRASGYRRSNQPALVFIDKKDELISFRELSGLIYNPLDRWRIVTVSTKESGLKKGYHHLIIDGDAVGAEQWLRMKEQMMYFLWSDKFDETYHSGGHAFIVPGSSSGLLPTQAGSISHQVLQRC
jgi:esterase/lipase